MREQRRPLKNTGRVRRNQRLEKVRREVRSRRSELRNQASHRRMLNYWPSRSDHVITWCLQMHRLSQELITYQPQPEELHNLLSFILRHPCSKRLALPRGARPLSLCWLKSFQSTLVLYWLIRWKVMAWSLRSGVRERRALPSIINM